MDLDYLNIGRIGRCEIEGAGKKSFPAKEMIQEAQRRESMTSYGRKAKSFSLTGARATPNTKE